jgi:gamma-glutamyl-gamma-aminobutyrate hydrolase PuuD
MRLALTTRRILDPVHGEARDALSEDWCMYLYANWPEIVILPLLNSPCQVAQWATDLEIDAAILTNGNDWGESNARDETERALVAWCRARGRPVLGVCRGFQVLNALAGGAIETKINSIAGQSHSGICHDVTLTTPQFINLAGDNRISVNSFHEQAVTRTGLAADLIPFALAQYDVVEGFHHATEALLGVQWHPERPGAPTKFDRAIFDAFLTRGAFWIQT